MNKNLSMLAGFGALLILAGAGCAAPKTEETNTVSSQPAGQTEQTTTATETKPAATETAGRSMLTVAEVAKHNVPEDCYIIVRDSVYDVTKFTDKHPGGSDKIIPLCGKDATGPFTQVHGGQPKPENVLTGLKIGALQK
jgi:cytochrome b involved in lipid metabolism